jgi:hypothetical protein
VAPKAEQDQDQDQAGDDDAPVTARVDKIEAEQERQGGVLDKILGKLGGGDSPDHPDSVTRGDQPPAAAAADMAEQMRQAVRDVNAEDDAELGRAHRLGQGQRPPAETSPREVMIRGKDRLQRAFFGGDGK